MAVHRDRIRAKSFGVDAVRYDRARPAYPDAMVDDLIGPGTKAAIDVGCGTGKAAAQFHQRGLAVLGVEPDHRMAAVARSKGIEVIAEGFEDWDPDGRTFDLLTCGQAWHWLDPARAPAKAVDVLRVGGTFAAFWNRAMPSEPLLRLMRPIYEALAPSAYQNSVFLGTLPQSDPEPDEDARALQLTGEFEHVKRVRYRWSRSYSTSTWVDELPTHSNHGELSEEALGQLIDQVAAAIDSIGGRLDVPYETSLLTATRVACAETS